MKNSPASVELYDAYEFVLPPKYEGGCLLIALFQKIESRELGEVFSTSDIKHVVAELRQTYPVHPQLVEPLVRRLSRYIIRDEPGQLGKFRLTGHAKRLMQLLHDKVKKPYKDFPLQQSFEKHFTITAEMSHSLDALRIHFDAGIVSGHKQVIYQHLESLQDELDEAHSNLEKILHNQSLSPVAMAEQFAGIFRAFGDRADDISHSIASKDRFLKALGNVVNGYHHQLDMAGNPQNEQEQQKAAELQMQWEAAMKIQDDLEGFFEEVEATIMRIRAQIIFANDRLTELHENFTKKSQLQINLKRLLQIVLHDAYTERGEIHFSQFPLKGLPYGRLRLLFPQLYSFELPNRNVIPDISPDTLYLERQRQVLELRIQQRQLVAYWVKVCKRYISVYGKLELHVALNKTIQKGADLQTALEVAYELNRFAITDSRYQVWSSEPLVKLQTQSLYLWTTQIAQNRAAIAS